MFYNIDPGTRRPKIRRKIKAQKIVIKNDASITSTFLSSSLEQCQRRPLSNLNFHWKSFYFGVDTSSYYDIFSFLFSNLSFSFISIFSCQIRRHDASFDGVAHFFNLVIYKTNKNIGFCLVENGLTKNRYYNIYKKNSVWIFFSVAIKILHFYCSIL